MAKATNDNDPLPFTTLGLAAERVTKRLRPELDDGDAEKHEAREQPGKAERPRVASTLTRSIEVAPAEARMNRIAKMF